MNLKPKHIVYIALLALGGWFLYLGREVLPPFLFAAVFAYLLNPTVNFLSHRVRLPRTVAVLIVFLIIIVFLGGAGYFLGGKLVTESKEFASEGKLLLINAQSEAAGLPSWMAPSVHDLTESVKNSINFSSEEIVRFFSNAISSLVSFFIFLFILFYFLKDGKRFFESLENLLPGNSKIEFAIVSRKVNQILGNYLRAQFSMIILMATITTILLSLWGVKYSFILGLVAGIAEIVPFVGPGFAFTTISLVVALTGGTGFLSLPTIQEGLVVGLSYLLINQLQNNFVTPQVTGRMVKLHPLLVLASVLVGGHLFGVVGILFAVPAVAAFKVVLEHLLYLLTEI